MKHYWKVEGRQLSSEPWRALGKPQYSSREASMRARDRILLEYENAGKALEARVRVAWLGSNPGTAKEAIVRWIRSGEASMGRPVMRERTKYHACCVLDSENGFFTLVGGATWEECATKLGLTWEGCEP